MKLSKTSWLILTIGVPIIAFSSVGFVRSKQLNEQSNLNEKLSIAKSRLNGFQLEQLSSQKEELKKQLSHTLSQRDTKKALLSQPVESINTSDTLFNIANTCDVEITDLHSSKMVRDNLVGIECSNLALTLSIEGDVPNLIDFIIKVNADISTGVVKSAIIDVPEIDEEQDGQHEGDEGSKESSAKISLVIYAYEGD